MVCFTCSKKMSVAYKSHFLQLTINVFLHTSRSIYPRVFEEFFTRTINKELYLFQKLFLFFYLETDGHSLFLLNKYLIAKKLNISGDNHWDNGSKKKIGKVDILLVAVTSLLVYLWPFMPRSVQSQTSYRFVLRFSPQLPQD